MSNWNNFIKTNNLEKKQDLILYGNANKTSFYPENNFFCDQYHYATLSISGKDASKFLHDLTTIDIHNLANKCMFGAFCDSKGKVITHVWIITFQNKYLLRLPLNMRSIIISHFKKYQPLYQLSIEDDSEKWLSLGIYSKQENLIPELQSIIQPNSQVTYADDFIFINKDLSNGIYELLTTNLTLFSDLWNKLSKSELQLTSNKSAKIYNIQKKLIEISPEISTQFTPNHLQYDELNGISFTKGCYLGQEIIARIRYKTSLTTKIQIFEVPINSSEFMNTNKIINKNNI
ncbi:MAG: hypothetical protein HRT87_08230, partial [Legionellales bacterium]|nr:hypothetical protein [Legionellales bacterium]